MNTTTIEQARQDYADWYVRERLVHQQMVTINDGRAGLAQMKFLGIDPEDFFGLDLIGMAEDLSRIGQWLSAEAQWHRLHAEAILRSYNL